MSGRGQLNALAQCASLLEKHNTRGANQRTDHETQHQQQRPVRGAQRGIVIATAVILGGRHHCGHAAGHALLSKSQPVEEHVHIAQGLRAARHQHRLPVVDQTEVVTSRTQRTRRAGRIQLHAHEVSVTSPAAVPHIAQHGGQEGHQRGVVRGEQSKLQRSGGSRRASSAANDVEQVVAHLPSNVAHRRLGPDGIVIQGHEGIGVLHLRHGSVEDGLAHKYRGGRARRQRAVGADSGHHAVQCGAPAPVACAPDLVEVAGELRDSLRRVLRNPLRRGISLVLDLVQPRAHVAVGVNLVQIVVPGVPGHDDLVGHVEECMKKNLTRHQSALLIIRTEIKSVCRILFVPVVVCKQGQGAIHVGIQQHEAVLLFLLVALQ
mmetsp:Transcript_18674/g.32389  ORF Transcript_18674/g.32389 Transcript_18674/m.32389 type:complete len:377 (-) Transcript_18674:400-1530(-)